MINIESNSNVKDKSPAEIRDIIQSALQSNQILGYLKNNILYMKSFGRTYSLDKIFASIAIITLFIVTEIIDELLIAYWFIILPIIILSFSLSFIFAYLFKFYLIYDIDREVFYTITNIHNYTLFKTNEISRKNIIELGVDVSDKDFEDRPNYSAIRYKGKLIDNPYLKTSFIALYSNGETVNISDPIPGKEAHETAVARCNLFSECFGLKATISKKDEYLLVKKDEYNNYSFEKTSRIPEWEKAKKDYKNSLLIALFIIVIIPIIIFLISNFYN